MSNYYDRDGQPIDDVLAWGMKSEDPEYKRVAEDNVGRYYISTVWLGLNHNWGDGPPLIFETMVFAKDDAGEVDFSDLDSDRYSTEAEAIAGHDQMVAKWRNKTVS
jgi:hypothetical protein